MWEPTPEQIEAGNDHVFRLASPYLDLTNTMVAGSFKRLRQIEVSGTWLLVFTKNPPPNLQSVHARVCVQDDLEAILRAYPLVRRLSVQWRTWIDKPMNAVFDQLEALDIYISNRWPYLAQFLASDTTRLTTLVLRFVDRDATLDECRLPPTLTHLSLHDVVVTDAQLEVVAGQLVRLQMLEATIAKGSNMSPRFPLLHEARLDGEFNHDVFFRSRTFEQLDTLSINLPTLSTRLCPLLHCISAHTRLIGLTIRLDGSPIDLFNSIPDSSSPMAPSLCRQLTVADFGQWLPIYMTSALLSIECQHLRSLTCKSGHGINTLLLRLPLLERLELHECGNNLPSTALRKLTALRSLKLSGGEGTVDAFVRFLSALAQTKLESLDFNSHTIVESPDASVRSLLLTSLPPTMRSIRISECDVDETSFEDALVDAIGADRLVSIFFDDLYRGGPGDETTTRVCFSTDRLARAMQSNRHLTVFDFPGDASNEGFYAQLQANAKSARIQTHQWSWASLLIVGQRTKHVLANSLRDLISGILELADIWAEAEPLHSSFVESRFASSHLSKKRRL